jgi:hypothetical protein
MSTITRRPVERSTRGRSIGGHVVSERNDSIETRQTRQKAVNGSRLLLEAATRSARRRRSGRFVSKQTGDQRRACSQTSRAVGEVEVKPMNVKFPHIKVQLVGQDGNAYSILGRVSRAMRRAGVKKPDIDAFMKEATSGDYDHLLATCMRWVDCD